MTHREKVDEYFVKNYDSLLRVSAKMMSSIAGNTNRQEVAHEHLSAYIEWVYGHPQRIAKIMEQGWLEKFGTVWLSRNRFRSWGKIRSEHVMPDDPRIWQNGVSHPKEEDISREMSMLETSSETAPPEALEYVKELFGMGLVETQVEKVISIRVAADKVLDPAEKILLNMLFRDGMTYREIDLATGIPYPSLYRMAKAMIKKIKDEINDSR